MMNDFNTVHRDESLHCNGSCELLDTFAGALLTLCQDPRFEESPSLPLLLDDIMASARTVHDMMKRAQATYETAQSAEVPARTLAGLLHKARERMRKLIKELQTHIGKAEPVREMGLADYMKPIIEKARPALVELLKERERDNPEMGHQIP